MAKPSVRPFVVLHALRLKGVAEAPAVAAATGLDGGDVEAALAALAGKGLVERRQGALPGWAPSALGRKHDDIQVAEELKATGRRGQVEAAYRQFLALNPELLVTCAAWQLRPAESDVGDPGEASGDVARVVNDHTDSAYDAEVVARLATVHHRAQPVLEALASALPRFAPYRPRLAHALDLLQAGEGDWFTRPVIDSYHSVWFELHQDLLQTLGLERGREAVEEDDRSDRPR